MSYRHGENFPSWKKTAQPGLFVPVGGIIIAASSFCRDFSCSPTCHPLVDVLEATAALFLRKVLSMKLPREQETSNSIGLRPIFHAQYGCVNFKTEKACQVHATAPVVRRRSGPLTKASLFIVGIISLATTIATKIRGGIAGTDSTVSYLPPIYQYMDRVPLPQKASRCSEVSQHARRHSFVSALPGARSAR